VLVTSAQRWNRVAALIDTALERQPDERAGYLDNACAGDAALRVEIEALIAGGQAPSFLDSGALVFAASLLEVLDEKGEGKSAAETSAPSKILAVLAQERAEDSDLILPDEPAAGSGTPYRLERKVGRGGMAAVYLARDTKHDRRVAVKVLHSSLTARVEAERFVQEIRLTARLQHPHVLGLLDSGVFPPEGRALAGRPYYVMPFVEGESLRARLARGGSLGLSEAVRLLRDVADALCYAHSEGVIHRDIKPENILISGGHAMVADFGIAKAIFASHSTESGSAAPGDGSTGSLRELSTLVGTPAYMAPEQAAAEGLVDLRADLYAWGVVAYELLAGRHPFAEGTSTRELVSPRRAEMPQPLHHAVPAVPVPLAMLVMRCLAKVAAERPSSGAEIVSALDDATVVLAQRDSMPRAHSRRWSLGVLAGLGIALVVAAVGVHAYWKGSRGELPSVVVVTGTGNAAVDVPAVQTAIDRADSVVLKGLFSFNTSPTKPIAPLLAAGVYAPAAEILVRKAIAISGARGPNGEKATIDGGTIPFYVDARRGSVRIRGLRFVRPIASAVLVYAVRGLEISDSKVERLVPFGDETTRLAHIAEAIGIDTRGAIPMPISPGNPENVSGHLLIANNEIDAAGATPHDITVGVLVFSVGQSPDREVDLDITGNRIRNATAGTINIRRVNGRVRVLGNTLTTSAQAPDGNDAVRLVNTGSYLMANNRIESNQRDGTGIAVFSQFAQWPMERAVVENNDVIMSAVRGAVFGDSSAGINIRGFAYNNVVRHNAIRGRARAALSMYLFRGGVPADNEFTNNRFEDFHAALADIFVGVGVVRGRIIGPGTVAGVGAGATSSR
jgi:serine/threonine protein kinase